MSRDVQRRRFSALLDREGIIAVPKELRAGLRPGQAVMVEIRPARRDGADAGPRDDEVAAIAALQSEHPDNVRRCLSAQGALLGRTTAGRAGRKAARR